MVAAKPKKTKNQDHPLYFDMIVAAIQSLKERKGSSRQAIVKYLKANYKVGDNVETIVKMTLKRNVISERIIQTSGTGASGSFKLPASVKKPAPKTTKKVVKKTVKKVKKAATPKKTSKRKSPAKKPSGKKSPAKKIVKKAASKNPTPKKKAAKPSKKRNSKKSKK